MDEEMKQNHSDIMKNFFSIDNSIVIPQVMLPNAEFLIHKKSFIK